jgi:hypothetical protein
MEIFPYAGGGTFSTNFSAGTDNDPCLNVYGCYNTPQGIDSKGIPVLAVTGVTPTHPDWTGNLQEWRNSNSTILSKIDSTGSASFPKINAVSGYYANSTAPVADGVYTVGLKLTGGGVNGTITTKGGIITAIQQAT